MLLDTIPPYSVTHHHHVPHTTKPLMDIRGAYPPSRCGISVAEGYVTKVAEDIRGAYPPSRCGISDLYHVTAAL